MDISCTPDHPSPDIAYDQAAYVKESVPLLTRLELSQS